MSGQEVDPIRTGEVTELLALVNSGSQEALGRLYELTYRDLRKLAAIHLRRERSGHTLQPTALVHEVFLKFAGIGQLPMDARHFFVLASRAMRRVLVDHARTKTRLKRGGKPRDLPLQEFAGRATLQEPERNLDIDRALTRLESKNAEAAKVVELFHYAGMTQEEIAVLLEMSSRNVKRIWQFARTWMNLELRSYNGTPNDSD